MTTAPARRRGPLAGRDRYTLGLYLVMVTWGWFLYSFNPSVPLLGARLGVSHAIAGLHGTAMACGSMTAGLLVPRVVRRLGRGRVLRAATLLLTCGVVVVVLAGHVVVTLLAVYLLSIGDRAGDGRAGRAHPR